LVFDKKRGLRLKQGLLRLGDDPSQAKDIEIIDVSGYHLKRIPSKKPETIPYYGKKYIIKKLTK
jgi:hypothetical protein